ncbi:MAG: mechanosensitive ion channel family protein [Alphaproteobacteria bacterium]
MDDQSKLADWIADLIGPYGFLYPVVILAAAALTYGVVRFVLMRIVYRVLERTRSQWDDILARRGVFKQLAFIAPALVLYAGVSYYADYAEIGHRVILAYIVINVVITIDRLLSSVIDIYQLYPVAKRRSIKGYVQLVKLVVYLLGGVLAICLLINQSPWGVLSGIGAMTAVLLFVFKDTILSLIASIQLAANDLVRPGDWIEIPEYGVDGDVIDVALHIVKVRNWDKTIVSVPTYKLIEGSFKNWRGMSEAGGRRIKRSLLIDQTSVSFCDPEMIERFRRIRRLQPYLQAKEEEIARANAELGEGDPLLVNRRALTNLGTFRAYVTAYLDENTKLRKDMTLMVRQLRPSPDGLPLEIYAFSNDTNWVNYEGIQADIFDHLLAVLPFFGLRVFQYPTGEDVRTLHLPQAPPVRPAAG